MPSYTINGVGYEYWSAENQRIIDKLVEREVYCCMTSEVEYMIRRAYEDHDDDNPIELSDCENMTHIKCSNCGSTDGFSEMTVGDLGGDDFKIESGYVYELDADGDGYVCPICGCIHETIDEARDCCGKDETVYKCDYCGEVLNEDEYYQLDEEPAEIYEWWAVSRWLGDKLKEQGCVVIDSWGKSYWGRECTGQAISLDGCIFNIAKDMQILKGMENEWSV